MTDREKFQAAEIHGLLRRTAYDALKIAEIKVDGIFLRDFPNHLIFVQTKNTLYGFIVRNGLVEGRASKEDGSPSNYLARHQKVNIAGSTRDGSMLKIGFIGVGMHLEFTNEDHPDQSITTSEIINIRTAPLIP